MSKYTDDFWYILAGVKDNKISEREAVENIEHIFLSQKARIFTIIRLVYDQTLSPAEGVEKILLPFSS